MAAKDLIKNMNWYQVKNYATDAAKPWQSQIEQNPFPYVDPEYEPDVDGDTNKLAKLNEPLITLSCNPN